MVVVKTNIAGVITRMGGITKKVNKELNKASEGWMRDVLKSARRRAPRDTGVLRRDMTIVKTNKGWDLIVASKQGYFQEMGFAPHWIHKSQILETNNSHLQGKEFFYVKKSKPFVRPALEHNMETLPKRLSSAVKTGISKK